MHARVKWGGKISWGGGAKLGSPRLVAPLNTLLQNGFFNPYLSRYNSILLTINVNTRLQSREVSMPLPRGAISLAINVNMDSTN